jgi:Ca-activated chloride channel family protein
MAPGTVSRSKTAPSIAKRASAPLFLGWAWRRRQYLISQFVQSRLLANLTVGVSRPLQLARLILLVLSVGLLIFTLARPMWGFAWEEATQRGLDIIVAIDTSRSMLAEDLAPNRLTRAKLGALDLMALAKNDRLGLVAFAGTAFLQCPLTLDEEAFRQSVEALEVGIIPQGGSAIGEAIDVAAKAFKEGDNHKILILLTDGEDHETGAIEAAERGARSGLKIFTVGVGTPNGELLREPDDSGSLRYVKDDEGNVVKSRLNETLLTQLATASDGFYLAMSGSQTMEMLYQRGLAPLPQGELSTKLVRRYQERFQWPLGIAILLLMIELFLPDRKKVREPAAPSGQTPQRAPLARAAAVLMALCVAVPGFASTGKALQAYEKGDFEAAEKEYLRLLEKRPNDHRLAYNAGAAAYQASRFGEAAGHFASALTSPDLELQERAYYNLGNTFFRLGDREQAPEQKQQAWEQSIKQFEGALKLNPQDADAQFNLDLVKQKLEQLKQQQEQQKQQNKDDQKKDDEKKDDSKDDQQKNENEKDQEKKDQKSKEQEDGKDDGKKPKPDESKQDQEQQQKQKQDKPEQDKKGESKPQDGSNQKPGEKPDEASAAEAAARLGKMTPEQVQRLLDAQKGEEKAMIFVPPEKRGRARSIKDW